MPDSLKQVWLCHMNRVPPAPVPLPQQPRLYLTGTKCEYGAPGGGAMQGNWTDPKRVSSEFTCQGWKAAPLLSCCWVWLLGLGEDGFACRVKTRRGWGTAGPGGRKITPPDQVAFVGSLGLHGIFSITCITSSQMQGYTVPERWVAQHSWKHAHKRVSSLE